MRVFISFLVILFGFVMVHAQTIESETSGIEGDSQTTNPIPNPANRALALRALEDTGLLLIPESTNDRVMAFDPISGDLVDPDFIPADATNLSTPICAIMGFTGESILVSDQIEDGVLEYGLDGTFIGWFAPAGGPDTSILDNIRGIALSSNNTLLVTVGSGSNADTIVEFDSSGNLLGNFVAQASGGLDSPFDVFGRASDYLVGGITSDFIHSYDLTGAFLSNFSPCNTFPEQIAAAAGGNVLVANFSGTESGIMEFTSAGSLVGIYDPASVGGYRGVYELPNGNILTSNGSGVHEIDRSGNLIETKIAGVSARFIEFAPPIVSIPAMGAVKFFIFAIGLVIVALILLRKNRAA